MIGAYIGMALIILCALCVIAFCIWYLAENRFSAGAIIGIILSVVIAVAGCFGIHWWLYDTESGKRAIKDFQSNTQQGIERTVTIYDINGEVVKSYSGRFDVETTETHVKFDDENGKRHMIYYTTGTIVIDEK